jgi:hypothetical protein
MRLLMLALVLVAVLGLLAAASGIVSRVATPVEQVAPLPTDIRWAIPMTGSSTSQ